MVSRAQSFNAPPLSPLHPPSLHAKNNLPTIPALEVDEMARNSKRVRALVETIAAKHKERAVAQFQATLVGRESENHVTKCAVLARHR